MCPSNWNLFVNNNQSQSSKGLLTISNHMSILFYFRSSSPPLSLPSSSPTPPTYLLQYGWQRTALAQPTPAGNGRILPDQQIVRCRQTDRADVGRKDERLLQLHQRQVELVREKVILRMDHLPGDAPLDVWQLFLHVRKVILADPYPNLGR